MNVKNIAGMFKNKDNILKLLLENCFIKYIIMRLPPPLPPGLLKKLCVPPATETLWS